MGDTAASSYSGKGQTQWGVSSNDVAQMSGGKSAGGMRGIGLVAFVLGQVLLNNKALSLAKDYYNVNKQDFNFFTSVHQAPMAASAAEAFNPTLNPAYVQDKYTAIPAAAARVADMDRQWFAARRSISRYATGAGARLDYEYAKNRSQQMAANWWLGWKSEFAYALEHNERQFNRKVMVVNIGIGAGNEVARGLAGAAGNLESALGNLGNQFGSLAGGLGRQIGQNDAMQQTRNTYNQITSGN